jgi:Ca2+:H+ antiporter
MAAPREDLMSPEKRRTSRTSQNGLPVHQSDVDTSNGVTKRIKPAGESGRSGIDPFHFLRIIFRSSSKASRLCNILWPLVPAAIAVRYALPDNETSHLIIFVLAYVAMIPCANLIGFAGQELARKTPHVWGVLIETTYVACVRLPLSCQTDVVSYRIGSVVEIILFMVLISRVDEAAVANGGIDYIEVIKAAILGSILATMLLCLGLCFIAGGVRRDEQTFSESVSEAGSGLLLTA